MLGIYIDCPILFRPKAQYVFDTFLTYFRVPYTYDATSSAFTIYYGNPAKVDDSFLGTLGGLVIPFLPSTESFFQEGALMKPELVANWQGLPYLFYNFEFSTNERWQYLPVDLIASAFFFLSTYQEYRSNAYDDVGRFISDAMLQCQLHQEHIPLVDRYFQTLASMLPNQLNVKQAQLPQNAPFCVCLSHDIDYVYREHGSNALRQTVQVAALVNSWIKGRTDIDKVRMSLRGFIDFPDFNIDTISSLEAKKGVRSSYYFIPRYGVFGEPYKPLTGKWRWLQFVYDEHVNLARSHKGVNADYELEDIRIKNEIKRLGENGFETGLHASYNAVPNHKLAEEVEIFERLGLIPYGMRVHHLRFRTHDLYTQLEETSLVYDYSLGIRNLNGYRTGTAFPHLIFDHANNRPFSTLAIPLHYMDAWHLNILSPAMKVDEEWDRLKAILDETRQNNLLLTVLTHNWLFANQNRRLYDRLLTYINEYGGAGVPAYDLYLWWKQLNQVQVFAKKVEHVH